MKNTNAVTNRISLANPIAAPLVFTSVGLIGFLIYQNMLSAEKCRDPALGALFPVSGMVVIFFLIMWARQVETLRSITITPLSPYLVSLFIIFKLYSAVILISNGVVSETDARLASYGSSVMIMMSTALGPLFFPITFFATRRKLLRVAVFFSFIIGTVATLVFAPSKSGIFSLFFSIMLYFFLKRKLRGKDFPLRLFSLKSLIILIVIMISQIFMLTIIFPVSFTEFSGIILNRIYYNFDSAIYACQLPPNTQAPNNFFTYTVLPILKRLDSSYYDLDFFNVSQFLLYEIFDISRIGRFGYPNDNLFVGLYVGGFGLFSIFIFLLVIFGANWAVTYIISRAKKVGKIGAFSLAVIFEVPLMYQSAQEFFGFLILLGIFLTLHRISNFRLKTY